jgi:hypothetical protein
VRTPVVQRHPLLGGQVEVGVEGGIVANARVVDFGGGGSARLELDTLHFVAVL